MAQEFELRQMEAQPVLSIRATSRPEALSELFGELFGEVWNYVQSSAGAPAGMPFTRYHDMDEAAGLMHVECGLPVDTPLPGQGRIEAEMLPAGTVAVTTHIGPYHTLGESHEALHNWVQAQGYEPAGPPWEVYVTDPGEEPDPNKWRTDIFMPVHTSENAA